MSASEIPASALAKHPELRAVDAALRAHREGSPVTAVCPTCGGALTVTPVLVTGALVVRCSTGCTVFRALSAPTSAADADAAAQAPLSAAFQAYLRGREPAAGEALAHALAQGDRASEAALLRAALSGQREARMPAGPLEGRAVVLGESLPSLSEAGALWFDTVELALMILVPRPPEEEPLSANLRRRLTPFVGWLALRPVATWQLAALLAQAPLQAVPQQLAAPLRLLDPQRLLRRAERASAEGLCLEEAILYAGWFGKTVARQGIFQAAGTAFPGLELWGEPRKEWAGRSSVTEGVALAVTPETVARDLNEDDEPRERALRMRYGDWDAPAGITFRTMISAQSGLLQELPPSPLSQSPLSVRAPLPR